MCPRRSALEAEGQAIDLTCSSVCIRLGVVLGRFWVPLKKDYRGFFLERGTRLFRCSCPDLSCECEAEGAAKDRLKNESRPLKFPPAPAA